MPSQLMRALHALVLVCASTAVVAAQVPRPERRSKDDHHKTSAEQHERVEQLARAWAACLAPHLGASGREEIRTRIEGHLQNQYSEWATHDFWQEVAGLVYDEIVPKARLSTEEARLAVEPGGALVPIVDELLRRAAEDSDGVLLFDDSRGGHAFEEQHDRLLRKDPALLDELRGLLRRRELAPDQAAGAQDLAQHYLACFRSGLPIDASSKAGLERMVRESILQPDGERASFGVRNKLRFALRNHVERASGTCKSLADLFRLQDEIDAFLDQRVAADFWSRLAEDHARMLAEPRAYRAALRERKDCRLAEPSEPPAEAQEPPR